ncbi:hypothetical protein [Geobacter sp. DSM 9736]|uniref:hypothetical protein n=1 Tax=Geobacter sp. DSM 9736 TaxID=1277350 RepID=UPI000B5E1BA3|nr:hypothetical protein [Geobacter sp. DSM 9736]SNB48079.1 hypothetical protein SAMN06269301_3575 [Geobacter sp. DSM 9736]
MSELFQSIGEIKSVYTLVDFYQYIKGVEYLICVAFFCGFPIFYRYIHKSDNNDSSH